MAVIAKSREDPPAESGLHSNLELDQWHVIRPRRRWSARGDLSEAWSYRDLAVILTVRDIRLRYRQTALGVVWAVLQPLIAMAAFSAVFGQAADIPSDGLPYPVFVLSGLAVWLFLSNAAVTAAESLVAHPDLVTRVWFPRSLAPVAAVLALTVDLGISVLLLVPVMAAYGVAPPLQVLTLPLWLLGTVLLAIALGLLLSAANVLYRDVRYAITFVIQAWLFVTPVVFPSSLVHGAWSYVLALNPAAGLIDGVRWALLDGPSPGPELWVSLAMLALLLVAGVFYFGAMKDRFADRI